MLVMGGWKALRGVLPAAAVCGVTFAGLQFLVSNFVSVQITDIVASLGAMGALVLLLRVWTPADATTPPHSGYTRGQLLEAWSPYLVLVVLVIAWGTKPILAELNRVSVPINWPWLHNQTLRMPPVVARPTPYAAVFNFNWLSAAGTSCTIAAIIAAFLLRMSPRRFAAVFVANTRRLLIAEFTMALVLAIAFLMNYSGATGTLGLAFAATGGSFPFFSAILGWLGVFLTGSDTSANALFGSLQVVTATRLGMSPVLMAAANSSGGVMGKMISLASIAVASAATGMKREEESQLFRFTIRHSIFLASMVGLVVLFYTYVAPSLIP
jgi:lactate permease